MCRRYCFALLLVVCLCCWLCSPVLAADGEGVDELTVEQLYQLVGIDPADEDAVDLFLVWLSSLDCGAAYQDFLYAYTMAGYAPDGAAPAYAAYCSLRDYEPELTTVTQNQYYTRYTGEDVALTYYRTNDLYPAGSWVLGTTGKTGTNGYFETRIINLTEMQEEIKNAVTYSDLSPLTTILNTINTNILAGNKTLTDYLPALPTIADHLRLLRPDVTAIKDDLLSYTNYISTSRQSILTYDAGSGSTTPVNPTGLMALLAAGFNAVAETDFNSENSRFKQFSKFFDDTTWSFGSFIASLGRDDIRQVDIKGTGLYSLLGAFPSILSEDLAVQMHGLYHGLNGNRLSSEIFAYVYDPATGDEMRKGVDNIEASLFDVLQQYLLLLQHDTAALAFVFADDDARRLHAANKPLEGAIEDKFTGGADAAPDKNDIADAADITSGVKNSLGKNPAGVGEFFKVYQEGGESYDFFSKFTEQSLDAVSSPAAVQAADEDPLSAYVFDDQGFGTLRDTSLFSFQSVLGGASN